MLLSGEKQIALPRTKVWEALNDPDVLKRCVPGCDTFEPDGDNVFMVGLAVSVGPIKARFSGQLRLSEIVPPESYALTFEGSGGTAGFGKGTAKVALTESEQGTLLAYSMTAQVGGKLAQVGGRLIDGVSKKLAEEFFSRFVKALQADAKPEQQSSAVTPDPSSEASPTGRHRAGPRAVQERGPQPQGYPAPAAFSATQAVPVADRSLSSTIAVLGAAISALAASVAVLAATITIISNYGMNQ